MVQRIKRKSYDVNKGKDRSYDGLAYKEGNNNQ